VEKILSVTVYVPDDHPLSFVIGETGPYRFPRVEQILISEKLDAVTIRGEGGKIRRYVCLPFCYDSEMPADSAA
jgi:hypothetical protein